MRQYLVEPKAHGLISGGYRYNRMLVAACPKLELVASEPDELRQALADLTVQGGDWILIDSLFLEERSMARFVQLKHNTGSKLALVLHAFPSVIERAAKLEPTEIAALGPTAAELACIRELDGILCPGRHVQRQLDTRDIGARTLFCPPGAPVVTHELPQKTRTQGPRILSVGNITRAKGYRDGLLAITELENIEATWEIVGSLDVAPSFVGELKQEIRSAGLAHRVVFAGSLPHGDTLKRFTHSDLLLLPSYTENYPLVLLEAQAQGLPVVAYDVHGVPDIVTHGRDGLLAPAGDTTALAAHLRTLLTQAELADSYAHAALAAARKRPEWGETARTVEQLWQG